MPTRPWQDYCSGQCRKLAWKKDRISPKKLGQIVARIERLERLHPEIHNWEGDNG